MCELGFETPGDKVKRHTHHHHHHKGSPPSKHPPNTPPTPTRTLLHTCLICSAKPISNRRSASSNTRNSTPPRVNPWTSFSWWASRPGVATTTSAVGEEGGGGEGAGEECDAAGAHRKAHVPSRKGMGQITNTKRRTPEELGPYLGQLPAQQTAPPGSPPQQGPRRAGRCAAPAPGRSGGSAAPARAWAPGSAREAGRRHGP